MKHINLLIFISLLAVGKTSFGQGKLNMVGAYRMTKQVANDGTRDTLLKHEQLKIYTDHHMMYASPRANDSFGEYGIATYKVKGDRVVENIFYTSSAGEVTDSATLKISKLKDGYRQVIDYSDQNGTLLLTEDYVRAGKTNKTPLDGAWKQVRNVQINGNGDTLRDTTVTQFKVYQSGHFIWANPTKDPASNNFVTAYGYGTFKMNGKDQAEETNINSTYNNLVGTPVTIDIELMDKNSYKQTIKSDDGHRSVELYERLE